jgi:hypothetical protein
MLNQCRMRCCGDAVDRWNRQRYPDHLPERSGRHGRGIGTKAGRDLPILVVLPTRVQSPFGIGNLDHGRYACGPVEDERWILEKKDRE